MFNANDSKDKYPAIRMFKHITVNNNHKSVSFTNGNRNEELMPHIEVCVCVPLAHTQTEIIHILECGAFFGIHPLFGFDEIQFIVEISLSA